MPHRNPGKAPVLGGSISAKQELVLPLDTSQPLISKTADVRFGEIVLR